MSQDLKSKPPRPRTKTIIIILTAFMTIRGVFMLFIPGALDPESPPEVSWLIPLLGDGVVALAAPVIAVLLWKSRTLGVWTAAIALQILGTWVTAGFIILESVAGGIPGPTPGAGGLLVPFSLGLVNLYLLSRRSVRQYYTT